MLIELLAAISYVFFPQKKKDKKRKDKSISGSPISNDSEIASPKNGSDDQAMSESDLESKRLALLAQLGMEEPMEDWNLITM